jgi:hypothetical protein
MLQLVSFEFTTNKDMPISSLDDETLFMQSVPKVFGVGPKDNHLSIYDRIAFEKFRPLQTYAPIQPEFYTRNALEYSRLHAVVGIATTLVGLYDKNQGAALFNTLVQRLIDSKDVLKYTKAFDEFSDIIVQTDRAFEDEKHVQFSRPCNNLLHVSLRRIATMPFPIYKHQEFYLIDDCFRPMRAHVLLRSGSISHVRSFVNNPNDLMVKHLDTESAWEFVHPFAILSHEVVDPTPERFKIRLEYLTNEMHTEPISLKLKKKASIRAP